MNQVYKLFLLLILSLSGVSVSYSTTFSLDTTSANRFFSRGNTLLLFNSYDSSIFYFEQARKLFLENQNWKGYVATLNKLSENKTAQFELEEAFKLAEEALRVASQYLEKDNLEKATAWNNIGNAHYLKGQHAMALEKYERALEVAGQIKFDEEYLYSSPINLGIGSVFYDKEKYGKAFMFFKHALENNKESLGEDHPYVANSYLSLGNLYRNKEIFDLARDNYNSALDIYLDKFGPDHPDVATTYIGLADVLKNEGNNEAALLYYQRAELIYKKFLKEIDPKFGDVYLGYGDVAKNNGDYDVAIQYYQRAFDLYKQTIGEFHQKSVRSLLGIANTYMYQEKFLESLDYYGRVLDVNFKLVGEAHQNTSAAYNNLGSLYYFAGDFWLAGVYYEKALAIDIEIHGTRHPNVANAYYNLSRVYGEQELTRRALEYIESAIDASIIDLNDENFGSSPFINFFDNRDIMWFLSYKGELLEQGFSKDLNELDISLQGFLLIDSLVDRIKNSYIDRKDQMLFAEQTKLIYESAINSCFSILELFNTSKAKLSDVDNQKRRKDYEHWFFYFTEKRKAAVLFSSMATSNAKSFAKVPASKLSREEVLKKSIRQYSQELYVTPDSIQKLNYQTRLASANQEFKILIREFKKEYPKYYGLKYGTKLVGLNGFQSLLNDTTMVVSYYLMEDSLYASYISNSTFNIHRVYKSYNYENDIKALRKSILDKSDQSYIVASRKLYNQLFPEKIPTHFKNLIIIVDGVMASIPFEVLLTEEVEMPFDYSSLPYLTKEFNLSYTFSGDLLYNAFSNENRVIEKAAKDGVAIAPISFDGPYLDIMRKKKEVSYDESDMTELFSTLSASQREVALVDSLFQQVGKTFSAFLLTEATEKLVKEDLDDYQYVHFATHGFLNQQEPELSGILLSTDNSKEEDGILFSGEIYDLNLNSELVTISAFETGFDGTLVGEGVIGVAQALFYAGTKNVNISLWKVPDVPTIYLTKNFYQNMTSKDVPSEKLGSLNYAYDLNKSKLEMIKNPSFNKPFYWSTFILIGK